MEEVVSFFVVVYDVCLLSYYLDTEECLIQYIIV